MTTPKITATFDTGTGTLTLSGTDTVSNYRKALQSVKYQFMGTPLTSQKEITFSARDDGFAKSLDVKRTINVSP